jgi:beta-1,2-mannobiose phosphorylase / 1,2-beta-oligomannan phosphorylase
VKLKRYPGNPILTKNLNNLWEAGSVFNPSVLFENGIFKMFYRATNDIHHDKKGKYMSSIGYAESTDGIHFKRFDRPIIIPDQEYENRLGCEDPRVTKINDTYFLYYTAVGGIKTGDKVCIALATSKDLKIWKKLGVVGPKNAHSKAGCLFPEKINGKYMMLYTWKSDSPLSSIMLAQFDSLEDVIKPPKGFIADNIDHYQENVVFAPPEPVYRGAEVGAVPIKTKDGWLFIYCSANTSDHPKWSISAALLDLDDPRKILANTVEPILKPETKTELKGVVNNVTFPEGAVVVGDELYVYYGSGDQGCCLATCNFSKLINYLTSLITQK